MQRIHAEMRSLFDLLGYPQNETLQQLFLRVATDGGIIPAPDVLPTYESLIALAEQNLAQAFDIFPAHDVVVEPDCVRWLLHWTFFRRFTAGRILCGHDAQSALVPDAIADLSTSPYRDTTCRYRSQWLRMCRHSVNCCALQHLSRAGRYMQNASPTNSAGTTVIPMVSSDDCSLKRCVPQDW